MTSEFRKGQLVAVRDTANSAWHLRVYDHASPEGLHFCRGLERQDAPCWWNKICPAEVVWPNIFLSVEREIAETLREQRDQHYRQLHWLCERLQTLGECPPDGRFRNCRLGCPKCWKMALQEATKEYADGASEESPALGR